MIGHQYVATALAHWKKWLPKMTKELREAGTLNERAQKASRGAAEQVADLMARGFQKHEAEEMVLPDLILLPPER
ncbi:hypothetical protein M2323_001598 [Rhodoblastus acidophilus]|uniref:hypothetical protein n=1 Tax=Rhodoblastus acidophilus TaxID=1074 RepID=UPI0022259EC1|nr:hypothetical protein [Rhodoblastus acidophilus]MCW2283985.1 hypothetical protein [Rhodoblastus acidophilus]MCW2332681.1 hypothetical protein [Rhodoblastus acidophilus]